MSDVVPSGWGRPPAPALFPGETLIWRGGPDARGIARRALHLRVIAVYFVLATLADMVQTRLLHFGRLAVLEAGLPGLLTGAATLGLGIAFAWGIARTTAYTVTSRRVIMQFGLALPATLELPLERIAAASVRVNIDHTGDIALRLRAEDSLSFLKLWPHTRPWHWLRPEPMLRDVPRAAVLAGPLCRALEERTTPRGADDIPAGMPLARRRG